MKKQTNSSSIRLSETYVVAKSQQLSLYHYTRRNVHQSAECTAEYYERKESQHNLKR